MVSVHLHRNWGFFKWFKPQRINDFLSKAIGYEFSVNKMIRPIVNAHLKQGFHGEKDTLHSKTLIVLLSQLALFEIII